MFPYCCLLIICIMLFPCSVFKVHLSNLVLNEGLRLFQELHSTSNWQLTMDSWQWRCRFATISICRLRRHINYSLFIIHYYLIIVVGQSGLEPPTSRLSVVCSSQLSYWPISFGSSGCFKLVEISGIEPLTSCLQGRRSPSWAKPPSLHSPECTL